MVRSAELFLLTCQKLYIPLTICCVFTAIQQMATVLGEGETRQSLSFHINTQKGSETNTVYCLVMALENIQPNLVTPLQVHFTRDPQQNRL